MFAKAPLEPEQSFAEIRLPETSDILTETPVDRKSTLHS